MFHGTGSNHTKDDDMDLDVNRIVQDALEGVYHHDLSDADEEEEALSNESVEEHESNLAPAESKLAPVEHDDGLEDEINHVTKLVLQESLAVNNQETNGNQSEGSDEDDNYSEDETAPRAHTTKQSKLPPGPLCAEMRELAQIVATSMNQVGTCHLPQKVLHMKIMTHGSARLNKLWKVKLKLRSVRNHGYGAILFGEEGRRFREYRDRLLDEMVSESDIEEDVVESMDVNDEQTTGHYVEEKDTGKVSEDKDSTDNLYVKTPMKMAKQNELTRGYLSPEMQELAYIVARCLYETHTKAVCQKVVKNKIESHGSARLKQFWKIKSKLKGVQNHGYGSLLSGNRREGALFREYRDRLLEKMVSEGHVGEYEEIVDPMDVKNEETTDHYPGRNTGGEVNDDEADDKRPMSAEMQELAQLVARCIHEIGTGRLPQHLLHKKIKTHGSARLKKFWKVKSNLHSVRTHGYGALMSGTGKDRTRFLEYRDRLLEKMASESDAEDGV